MAKDDRRRQDDANGVSGRARREVGARGSSHARNKKDDPAVRRARGRAADPRIQRAREEQAAAEARLRQLAELSLASGAHPLFLEEARASVALDKGDGETQVVGEPTKAEVDRGGYWKPEVVADFVARSTEESGVPLKVTDPATIQKVATLMGRPPATVEHETALHLHRQIRAADEVARRWFPPEPESTPSATTVLEAEELLRQGYHVARVSARTGVAPEELRHLIGNDGYVR